MLFVNNATDKSQIPLRHLVQSLFEAGSNQIA